VTITGAGFAAGTTVSFGGVAAPQVTVVNGTTLRVGVPAHAAGAVDVVVTVGGETATVAGGYTYGTVNTLPTPPPSGGGSGAPSVLPGTRSAGSGSGGSPATLPTPRP
jgi:hypothetical protein